MIIIKGTEGDRICVLENEEAIVNLALTDNTYIGQKLSKTFSLQQKLRKIKKLLEIRQ